MSEKDLTLRLAQQLRRDLERDFKVVLVRTNNTFVDLDDRVSFANRYPGAILVSLHLNHGGGGTRGSETFYWRVDSYSLARRIQQELSRVVPAEQGNRGLVRRRLRLTRNPDIPCVLVEGGYLSHPGESRLLASQNYQERLAGAISRAIRSQAASGDSGMGPLPRPINSPPSRPTDAPE